MKAIELLKQDRDYCLSINNDKSIIKQYDEAIKEIEDLQQSNKDLLNTVIEAQKVIKNVLEFKKWDVQIVKP